MGDLLWQRYCKLLVGDASGNGIDLTPSDEDILSVRFQTRQWTQQSWASLVVRIHNLSDGTANQIQKEFTRVYLEAGYQNGSQQGAIFDGTIVQVRRGREDAANTYVEILALAGDANTFLGIVSTTLSRGSTFADRYQALTQAVMASGSITSGHTDTLPDAQLPRGRVYYGSPQDHLDDLCAATDSQCFIDQGKINLLGYKSYLPGQIVTLNSQTGLVGFPEQTTEGVKARSLLNPQFRLGGLVQINERDVQQANLITSDFSGNAQQAATAAQIAADGQYKIAICEHVGDTRGNDWYTDLTCIAANDMTEGGTQALSQSGHGYSVSLLNPPSAPPGGGQ